MSRNLLLSVACILGFVAIRSEAADKPQEKSKPVVTVSYPHSEERQRIQARLQERTEIKDGPLDAVLGKIGRDHGINIVLDAQSLAGIGIDVKQPVDMELSGITQRSALKLMLEPRGLTYVIEDDVLKVVSMEYAQGRWVTRVYPVADLASTTEELKSLSEAIEIGTGKAVNGMVKGAARSNSLVVNCPYQSHDLVEDLLKTIREAALHEYRAE